MRPIDVDAIPESATAITTDGRLFVAWSEIVKAPTLDYKDLVPQGEWIKRPDERICPFCNDRYSYFGGKEKNFCPNCGARMKGAD